MLLLLVFMGVCDMSSPRINSQFSQADTELEAGYSMIASMGYVVEGLTQHICCSVKP